MGTPEILEEVSLRDLSHEETVDLLLARLGRLTRLRQDHEQELNPRGIRLVERPKFETYGQLQKLGLEEEAKKILHPPGPAVPDFLKEEEQQTQPQEPPEPTLGSVIIRSASEKPL